MDDDRLDSFVRLMKEHEGVWKTYHIKKGVLFFETHGGIVIDAKNPTELEEKLCELEKG